MKKASIFLIIATLQLFISCEVKYKESSFADNKEVNLFPKRLGLLNDFENVFTKEQNFELNKVLSDFEVNSKKHIIIASTSTFLPYDDFQKYTIDLAKNWDIEGDNDGNTILIVFSKEHRKIGLSVASGVQIKDEKVQKIISEILLPDFKENNYYSGTKKGILELIKVWDSL